MGVSVVVSDFDGGWLSWQAIQDLPVGYIKPPPGLIYQAGAGSEDAARSLRAIGSAADERGIELIVPDVKTALSPGRLAMVGFDYYESKAAAISRTLAPNTSARRPVVSIPPTIA